MEYRGVLRRVWEEITVLIVATMFASQPVCNATRTDFAFLFHISLFVYKIDVMQIKERRTENKFKVGWVALNVTKQPMLSVQDYQKIHTK